MLAGMPDPVTAESDARLVLHASRAERDEGLLRVLLALLALGCALWLVLLPGRITKLLALCALPLALLMFRRGLAALRAPVYEDRLELDDQGFVLCVQDAHMRVTWSEVRAIELDEDRLTVMVVCRDGREIAVEPRYPELPLRELGETIARFHRRNTEPKTAPLPPDARAEEHG
jgi:hypothetical protein